MKGVKGSAQLFLTPLHGESYGKPFTTLHPSTEPPSHCGSLSASEALTRGLLALTEHGQRTPCQGKRRDRWTSEDLADREWAASVCTSLDCPVLAECGAAADEAREKWGVWAGVDRASTTSRRKAAS